MTQSEIKPVSIKMSLILRQRLKYRAKQKKLTIGQMIKNLLDSYEMQVDRIFKSRGLERMLTPKLAKAEADLFELAIKANAFGFSQEDFEAEVDEVFKPLEQNQDPEDTPEVNF